MSTRSAPTNAAPMRAIRLRVVLLALVIIPLNAYWIALTEMVWSSLHFMRLRCP